MADSELVASLARGDDRAMDELIARFGSRVCGFLDRLVADGNWADDLTQEVFVRIYERAGAYDPKWPVLVWLFAIARNLAVDLMRREGLRQRPVEHLAAAPVPDTLVNVERREFQKHLDAAIAVLPESHRSVFLLREQEGLSYEEVGEVLGISAKTVSSRLHRARVQLRTQLEKYL